MSKHLEEFPNLLVIFSKIWKIHDNNKISVKGHNAENYKSPAPNANGTDKEGHGLKGYKGYPGKPGQTGGSFLGKIMSTFPILSVSFCGIVPNNGSDGCDGKDA